jgi:DNA topoisomerase-1
MRTDSTNIAKSALSAICAQVESEYGKEYLQTRTYTTKSKSAQEAHEAIRPTNASKMSAGANDEQKKLYELIRTRTLASQMVDARIMRTTIHVASSSDTVPLFSTTGSRVVFDGWLKEDTAARGEDTELPKVHAEAPAKLEKLADEHKQTQPPNRYSEAGLIKELEKRGIGRPSTYASIMKTLNDREYVRKEGKTLIPSDTGDVVSTFLETHFPTYISDTFTAEMEDELDQIADGTREYTKTLRDFYTPFAKAVADKEDVPKQTGLGDVPQEFLCPTCSGPMEFKLSKSGRFMSCKRFPECNGARKADGLVIEPPKELDETCPTCNKHKLSEREGRFGKFVACSNYPKCKYIKRDALANTSGVKCTHCSTGEMCERRGRFGTFYSCSNYPDCKHAIKTKPTGNLCTLCNSLMMEGTKTIPERCSVKTCPNHNPHKLGA